MTKQKKEKQEKAGPSWAHDNDSDSENGDLTKWLYCNDTFGNSVRGEGWVCCAICKRWAHEQCAGIEDDEEENFVCDFCQ